MRENKDLENNVNYSDSLHFGSLIPMYLPLQCCGKRLQLRKKSTCTLDCRSEPIAYHSLVRFPFFCRLSKFTSRTILRKKSTIFLVLRGNS